MKQILENQTKEELIMEKTRKIIEIRDSNERLLLSFLVTEAPFPDTSREIRNNQTGQKGENTSGQDLFMTDAQKRYLFRILADQGKEGEDAHEYLKTKVFQVESLKEVTRLEASQAIERLLAESKGGAAK